MSNDNKPSWIDDLFGGRDKVYDAKNNKRISQDASDRVKSEENGTDYPHNTSDGDGGWHYSTDASAKGKHSNAPNSMNPNQEYGEG